jgi:hypothetical protein
MCYLAQVIFLVAGGNYIQIIKVPSGIIVINSKNRL